MLKLIQIHTKSQGTDDLKQRQPFITLFLKPHIDHIFLLISLNVAFSVPTVTWKITIFKLSKPVRFINCTGSTQCKLMLDCLRQMKFIDNDTSTSGLILDAE